MRVAVSQNDARPLRNVLPYCRCFLWIGAKCGFGRELDFAPFVARIFLGTASGQFLAKACCSCVPKTSSGPSQLCCAKIPFSFEVDRYDGQTGKPTVYPLSIGKHIERSEQSGQRPKTYNS
jgi:hypothetical protein